MSSIFRVIVDSGSHYFVSDELGIGNFPARLAGRFHGLAVSERPAVGDFVEGRLESGEWVYIEKRCERKNSLERRISRTEVQTLAVNVDLLLILCALNEDFNLNRLDRYVSLASQAGIPAMIGLSKLDLCSDVEAYLEKVEERFPSQCQEGRILAFSIQSQNGTEELRRQLLQVTSTGGTLAILGSSGVGKSTLTNWLLGDEEMTVSEIRESDGRGRHTTTFRCLHALKDGGWLMDTPGLRGINPEFSGEGVGSQFQDLEDLILKCRFSDCGHVNDPGCRVQMALESGDLSDERWDSFWKLKSEEQRQLRMQDPLENQRVRERWKKINQNVRTHMQFKRKQGYS